MFQWKIAGLFHDVGYPTQIAKDILKPFAAKVNEIKRNIGIDRPDIRFKIVPIGLENLLNDVNSFDLIQQCINDWDLSIDAKNEFDYNIESGQICHGMMSALCILYIIDLLYQRFNPRREYDYSKSPGWSQSFFETDVVPACAAIFIHNLPKRCFDKKKINLAKAPVAYLLKLSDCLQDWERPSRKIITGLPANLYDLRIEKNRIIFQSPKKRAATIEKEILSSILSPNIEFI